MGSQRENYIAVGCTFQRHTFFPRNSSIILSVSKRRNSFLQQLLQRRVNFSLALLLLLIRAFVSHDFKTHGVCTRNSGVGPISGKGNIITNLFRLWSCERAAEIFFIQMILELYCKRHKKVLL